MRSIKFLLTTTLIFGFITFHSGMAQSDQAAKMETYRLAETSSIKITGTSTIHDWECDVENFSSDLKLNSSIFTQPKGAEASADMDVEVTVPVGAIESGKGGMNDKMYNALNKDDHPQISYKLKSSQIKGGDVSSDGSFTLVTSGELKINGEVREITMETVGNRQADGTLSFKGEKELNMKDYSVDPPTAMFGTIRSGKMITVHYDVQYQLVQ